MAVREISDAEVILQLYPGYTDADTAIFQEFTNPDAKPEPGFVMDFIGSRIRTSSLWKAARLLEGQQTGIPVPGDFHAEAIEWIGVLKAVRSARDQYVAMELGAGFGPWSIAGAVAARRKGINDIRLCAVEGDPRRFQFLRQHFADNGFDPDRHGLFQAAVGVQAGTAYWPEGDDSFSSEDWGSRPMDSNTDYRGLHFAQTIAVKILPLKELLTRETRWDMLHIDVQGSEVEICGSCIDELSARVRWMIVATHSRKLDGDLVELMFRAGWMLEHEKPAKFVFSTEAPSLEAMTSADGTQVWRNPRLMHAGDPLSSFQQEITSPAREIRVQPGNLFSLDLITKNTGSQPWFGGVASAPVNAGYRWLYRDGAALPIEGNRAKLSRPVILPGESDRLQLSVLAPAEQGIYTLRVSMVQETVAWFFDRGGPPLDLRIEVVG